MKYLKYGIGILLLLILLGILAIRLFVHESAPTVMENQDAQVKAQQMLKAVNKAAWDTLPYISWSFPGGHDFIWDKTKNDALVKWADKVVHLDPDEVTGKAYQGDVLLEGDESNKVVQEAWSMWCNDMFWLSAPYKILDKGVSLKMATDKDGKEGLLATYDSGGVTPGDSYLWYLDDNGLPTGYKMWVGIIPVGGVYTSWTGWTEVEGGAKIATTHQGNVSALKIDITNLKAGDTWSDLGYDQSPIKL